MGYAGCAMHKSPRRSKRALVARRVYFLIERGSRGPPTKLCTRAPTNLATPLNEISDYNI